MAWRLYKIAKKLHREYEDGYFGERVWITLPKNKVFPPDYGFSVSPKFSYKNKLYMPDSYKLDICIDPLLREKGKRYKHFKMKAEDLRELLLFKYEIEE